MMFYYEIRVLYVGDNYNGHESYEGEVEGETASDAYEGAVEIVEDDLMLDKDQVSIEIMQDDGEGFWEIVILDGININSNIDINI